MQNNGWIKLHRKILQNKELDNDRTARALFIDLMLICDRRGEWSGGRYQLADLCKLNPNTTKGVLKRLKKYGIVTTKRHQHYSTITICNWGNYQTSRPLGETIRKTIQSDFGDHSYKNVATKNKEAFNVVSENSPSYLKAKAIREKLHASS